MNILCDYCNKQEAFVFCSADEAALCSACDHQVHQANKLAEKHLRFSLIQQTSNEIPLCDICQERRAILFCKEDRAILCKECDIPIHRANEHTQKHNRFLLTGVKLSAASKYPTKTVSSDESNCTYHEATTRSFKPPTRKPVYSVSSGIWTTASSCRKKETLPCGIGYSQLSEPNSVSANNISEYLMKGIPGWKVEDLLDIPRITQSSFVKNRNDLFPILIQQSHRTNSSTSEDLSFYVPQSPTHPAPSLSHAGKNSFEKLKGLTEEGNDKFGRIWNEDFPIVPEIGPSINKARYFC